MSTCSPGGKTSAYIPIGWGAGLLGLGVTWLLHGHDVGTDPDVFIGWENETKMPFFIMNYFALWTGLVLSAVVIFNASTPQTRKEDVVEDLQVQGQGLAITNFLFVMVWVFAYPAYIKFPGKEMRDFYPVFTLFNAWMGLIIFIFLGLSSKRFRLVQSIERLYRSSAYSVVQVCVGQVVEAGAEGEDRGQVRGGGGGEGGATAASTRDRPQSIFSSGTNLSSKL